MKCARSEVDPLPAMLLSEIFIRGIPLRRSPVPSPVFFLHAAADCRKEQLLQVSDAGSTLLVPVAGAVISGPGGSMRGCVLQCGVLAHLDMKGPGRLLQSVCSGCHHRSVERRPRHIQTVGGPVCTWVSAPAPHHLHNPVPRPHQRLPLDAVRESLYLC